MAEASARHAGAMRELCGDVSWIGFLGVAGNLREVAVAPWFDALKTLVKIFGYFAYAYMLGGALNLNIS